VADLSSLLSKLNGLDVATKKALTALFTELVPNTRFGHPKGEQPDPSKNFGGGFFQGTTSAVADREFSITHGFGRAPYLAIPVLPLDQVGSQIPLLTVTRAADDKRVYFSCPDTDVPFTIFLEG
jgi:hypothetical protein